MDLEARLKYCKLCQNRNFDFQKGLLCNLTLEKPIFENNCEDYLEDPVERKNFETNQFYDTPRNVGFLGANTYPTSNILIKIAQTYLPDNFNLISFNFLQLFGAPIFFTVLFFLAINFLTEPLVVAIVIATILSLGVYLTIRVWKQTFAESTTIATFTSNEVTLKNGKVILWNDVTLAHIQAKVGFSQNSQVTYLKLDLLSESTPELIQINHSLGSVIILTIAEAYRKRKNSNIV